MVKNITLDLISYKHMRPVIFLLVFICMSSCQEFFREQPVKVGSSITGKESKDQLGRTVAISEDGGTIAIASTQGFKHVIYGDRGQKSGGVSVYRYTDSNWKQLGEEIVCDPKTVGMERFGSQLELSGDGNRLVIAGRGHNRVISGGIVISGMVVACEWDGENWRQVGSTISSEYIHDILKSRVNVDIGRSISISADGKILAISVNDCDKTGVLVLEEINQKWKTLGNIIEKKDLPRITGRSVRLSKNGKRLIISESSYKSSDRSRGVPPFKVFDLVNDKWVDISNGISVPLMEDENEYLTKNIVLSVDSNADVIIAGLAEFAEEGTSIAEFYEFIYKNSTWTRRKIKIDIGFVNGQTLDIDLSQDGSTLAVGNPQYSDGKGLVKLFYKIDGRWLTGSDIEGNHGESLIGYSSGAFTGSSISISQKGNYIVVGSPQDCENGYWKGQTQVYKLK